MLVVLYGLKTKITILILLIFASSFAKTVKNFPPLEDASNQAEYDKKYEEYGAYIDKYEKVFSSFYNMSTCNTRVSIDLTIRILTTDGAKYGTIPIRTFGRRITKFESHMFDASGNEVELDLKKMKKEFLESGKVVFPKVVAGTKLTIKIEFFRDHTYYTSLNSWFPIHLPVRIGRFIHKKSGSSDYDYRVLGNRFRLKEMSLDKGNIKSWTLKNYEPRKDLKYQDYKTNTEPRVLLRLRKVRSWNRKYNSKKTILKQYKSENGGFVVNLQKDKIKKIATKCVEDVTEPLKKASIILAWVQNTITSWGRGNDLHNDIMITQKGSNMEVASLCNEMFKQVGLNSELVFACDKNDHIMDSSFILYNYDKLCMPIVNVGGKQYPAYVYKKGYGLGVYPASLDGVLCMNTKQKRMYILPPSTTEMWWTRTRRILDFKGAKGEYILVDEYRYRRASSRRNVILSKDKCGRKTFFQNNIKSYKEENKLISYNIKNLNKYEKPLSTIIRFENYETSISHKGKRIFKLNSFFKDYYQDITVGRQEAVVINSPVTIIDEIEILKISGKKIRLNIDFNIINKNKKVEDVFHETSEGYTKKEFLIFKNDLFNVSCKNIETDSSYIFQRTLLSTPVHITKMSMSKIYNDCVKLNSIKNSTVIISNR